MNPQGFLFRLKLRGGWDQFTSKGCQLTLLGFSSKKQIDCIYFLMSMCVLYLRKNQMSVPVVVSFRTPDFLRPSVPVNVDQPATWMDL